MKHSQWLSILLIVVMVALFFPITVRADIAPPEQPPGASIVPWGAENTQVRMVSETVTLTVLSKPSANQLAQAATVADFTMRNLGTETETMQAIFPLTFWNGYTDGFGNQPEITDIRIFVNNKEVPTHRIEDGITSPGGVAYQKTPWAAFDVSFPPNSDVNITVKYTTNGYGYAPNFDLRYILQTGSGWNDTIGSADIIIKLPYPATKANVLQDNNIGFGDVTPGMQLIDDTVRWHFENFEPTRENDISVLLVMPEYWQKILDWKAQTQKTPNDGEVWGQLGKAIKEAMREAKGFPREDAAAKEMYVEAEQAYEKAVTLLPKDALWHYGFADLLWNTSYFSQTRPENNTAAVSHAVDELRLSLLLDPKNQRAKDLAAEIANDYPWAITKTDSSYDFPVLTATPTTEPATETPLPEATSTLQVASTLQPDSAPTQAAAPAAATKQPPVSPTQTPRAGLPLCGGAGLIVLPALALFWRAAKKKRDSSKIFFEIC